MIDLGSTNRMNSIEIFEPESINRNTSNFQRSLIQMGFDIKLTNNIISHFQINSIETAIEYMIKTDNKWNHPFVQTETDGNDMCLVCGEESNTHRINLFHRNRTEPINFIPEEIQLRRFTSMPIKTNLSLDDVKLNIKPTVKKEICEICLGEINNSFNKCLHKFCLDCIIEYIKNKINNSEVTLITCPSGMNNCQFIFNQDEIKGLISDRDYERYLKFKHRAEILKIPNAVVCPIPDCDSYAIKTIDDNRILACIKNNHNFCTICNQLEHPGIDCDQNLEIHLNQWKKLTKFIKKCPKCKFLIQKNEGCNHMTCGNSSCKYQFCWICMGQYSEGHYSNIFSPCCGLQYTNQSSVLVKVSILRYFKMLGMFIMILLIVSLAIPLISVIILFILSKGLKFTSIIKNSFNRRKKFLSVIYYLMIIFIGMSIAPLGYMLLTFAIFIFPLLMAIFGLKIFFNDD